MDPLSILQSFGFQAPAGEPPTSLYPYAPVFRVEDERGAWIVKRGRKPFKLAEAVTAWTRALAEEGIPTVTPAPGFGENPRRFPAANGEEEVWVVYPFIPGTPYSGSLDEIRSAGELLGRLHAYRPQQDFGLKKITTVESIDQEEVEGDIAGILAHVERFYPQALPEARAVLQARARDYFDTALPRLLSHELPLANCTWDYKASNLVFQAGLDSLPVLINPDNAGRIPRLYDLAIASLLFHNEGLGPGRLFTTPEWEAFLEGYFRHIRLSPEERAVWDDLLLCAWVDEALWLLNDAEEDWANPSYARMLLSLLLDDLGVLGLPQEEFNHE